MKHIRNVTVITLSSILASVMTFPVFASPVRLDAKQQITKMTEGTQKQEYLVAYRSEGTESTEKVRAEMELSKGFSSESLILPDWEHYEGNVVVSLYSGEKEQPIFRETKEEGTEIKVIEEGVTRITVEPETTLPDGISFTGFKVCGTLSSKEAGETHKAEVKYLDVTKESSVILDEKTMTTDCRVYLLEKPNVTLSKNTLEYLEGTELVINNLNSNTVGQSATVRTEISMPERMFVDRIQMPEFEKGTIKLFINGQERDTREEYVYVNGRVESLVLEMKPGKNPLEQKTPMIITMRNTDLTATEEQGVPIHVSVNALLHDGINYTVNADDVYIVCLAGKEEPEEPDQPGGEENPPVIGPEEKPEEPNIPQKPGKPVTPDEEKPSYTPDIEKPSFRPDGETEESDVVDFSGLNLTGTKVTGGKTILASIKKTDALQTDKLHKAQSDRVQTTKVFDFSSGNEGEQSTISFNGELEALMDEEAESSAKDAEKPADEIKENKQEEAKKAVKEAVKESETLPIILVIIITLAIGSAAIYMLLKDNSVDGKQKDMISEPEETEEEIIFGDDESTESMQENKEK